MKNQGLKGVTNLKSDLVIKDLVLGYTSIHRLSDLYKIDSIGEIASYLNDKPHELYSFLIKTHEILADYFPNQEILLEVFRDPEDYYETELFIIIRTSQSAEEALTTLDVFNEKYWFNQKSELVKKVSISVDFE